MTSMNDSEDAEYVIGLDIGDGESALAWLSVGDRELPEIFSRRHSGERSIITTLARKRSATGQSSGWLIGEEAVVTSGAIQLSVNFKHVPRRDEFGTPDAVLFAQALLEEFRQAHPDILQNCCIYLGHPSGWPDDAVATYRRHFAALDLPLRLMPESHSALLYLKDRQMYGESSLDRVLVVDIGSSTTDFTYVEDLTPENLPVGASLGCRAIDRKLADKVRTELEHDLTLAEALQADGGTDFLLLTCRWAKEAQFSGVPHRILSRPEAHNTRFAPIVKRAWQWLQAVEIPAIVAESGGWLDEFHALLVSVRDQLGDRPPQLVVLTGGGSRMPCVRRACQAVFQDSVIHNDSEPSFAVARGLAINGRHRTNTRRFRQEMRELPSSPEFRNVVRREADHALSRVKQSLLERASTSGIESVLHTLAHSQGAAGSDPDPAVDAGVRELVDAVNAALGPKLLEICRRYAVPDDQFQLTLTLPDVFSSRIAALVARRVTAIGWTEGAWEFTQNAARATPHLYRLGRLLGGTKSPYAVPFAIGAAAVGGMVSLSGQVVANQATKRILRELRDVQLTKDAIQLILDEVTESIVSQTDVRARTVERFLF